MGASVRRFCCDMGKRASANPKGAKARGQPKRAFQDDDDAPADAAPSEVQKLLTGAIENLKSKKQWVECSRAPQPVPGLVSLDNSFQGKDVQLDAQTVPLLC